ncbi:MAG: hypothetical protein M1833_004043 [Piccolia ochrophora]|nr:MAG: hypothetical protein M1833_004043 [Piccolia ochrophora]
MGGSKQPRVRRKSAGGGEHVKHRRTRSGCFTCRSRRVKCDEARPVCERCRKGGRDCSYPEPPPEKSSSSAKTKAKAKARSKADSPDDGPTKAEQSSSEEDSEESDRRSQSTDAGDDDDERAEDACASSKTAPVKPQMSQRQSLEEQSPQLWQASNRKKSDTPSLVPDKSPSASTEGSTPMSGSLASSSTSRKVQQEPLLSPTAPIDIHNYQKLDRPPLSQEMRFYINHHQTQLTYHHYAFKNDCGNFLRTVFLEMAMQFEPLLHAAVGFAAFQYAVRNPTGKMEDFLKFYDRSVSSLLKFLQRRSKSKLHSHAVQTLLTILQLATIEEYLGDWVNLLNHQKAACSLLRQLYNPATVMQTELTRAIMGWYSRFDVYAGLLGGYKSSLGREWFAACQEHYAEQSRQHPTIVSYRIEETIAKHRLLARDMGILFARRAAGELNEKEFNSGNEDISQQFRRFRLELHPRLTDPRHTVTSFEGVQTPCANDIVDPFQPGVLFKGPLWQMNFCFLDSYATDLMHRYQTALLHKMPPSEEVVELAYKACQLFEAVEFYPDKPAGALLAMQAAMSMATLFLPKDDRHVMWCRKKFAMIESLGFIYPATFRVKMAEMWGIDDVQRWWLPTDDNYPPLIRRIRAFVDGRSGDPHDSSSSDLKSMKAIFSALSIGDSPTGGSASNTLEGIEEHPDQAMRFEDSDATDWLPPDNAEYDAWNTALANKDARPFGT